MVTDVANSIERIPMCSMDEFQRRYVKTSTPVIFTGMMDDWPARRLWSLDYLQSKFGTTRMTVGKTSSARLTVSAKEGIPQEEMEFGRYIDLLREGNPAYYLITSIDERLPELLSDIIYPEIYQSARWTSVRLWVSGHDTHTPLHHDLPENLYAMIFGRKRVLLVHRNQARNVYLHGRLSAVPNFCRADVENPDYERFPRLRRIKPLAFTVEAGEVLYIPRLWFHQFRALQVSASLALWWASGAVAVLARVSHAYARMRKLRR
ncbi:MAG: cupin-like domain-containing protein [Nitrospiraceae bacterium]